MAVLNLKTTYELTGLNIKDIKGSKSTTKKTFISRAKKEIDSLRAWSDEIADFLADFKSLKYSDFLKKYQVAGGFYLSDTREEFVELHLKHYEDSLADYQKRYNAAKNAIENGIVEDEDWLLWFAFDEEATKVYGKLARELYDLLSDGKDHSIRGEIVTGGNQYEIISWEAI